MPCLPTNEKSNASITITGALISALTNDTSFEDMLAEVYLVLQNDYSIFHPQRCLSISAAQNLIVMEDD